jgi:hypothetical protein
MEDIYESRVWFDTEDKDWKLEIYLLPLGEANHRVGPIFKSTYTAKVGVKRALKTQLKKLQSQKSQRVERLMQRGAIWPIQKS